jgi:hypothetical protein
MNVGQEARMAARPKLKHRNSEVSRALGILAAAGKVAGTRSTKISVRVDPGILSAAAARFGMAETEVSDVVNASLAVAAAPDSFKEWLASTTDTLPDDFEIAI